MRKILAVITLALLFMFSIGSQPVSAYYLDFNITSAGTTTGKITFDRNNLTGTAIEVDFVSLMDNNNVEIFNLPLSNGRLAFQSYYAGSDWDYNGGTISITETFAAGKTITLMAGNVNWMSVAQIGAMGSNDWEVTFGEFTDKKHIWLLDSIGKIPPEWWGPVGADDMVDGFQGNLNVGFYGAFDANRDFFTSEGISSGDVHNYLVPIPAAVWLLGSGFFGLIAIRRRRK